MSNDQITAKQILLPLTLLSFVVALFLGFQTSLLFNDRATLQTAYTQQEKPLEQAQKVKAQVNALAVGTLHLSQQGNEDARAIIAGLKKAGIDVSDQAPTQSAPSHEFPSTQMAPAPQPAAAGSSGQ